MEKFYSEQKQQEEKFLYFFFILSKLENRYGNKNSRETNGLPIPPVAHKACTHKTLVAGRAEVAPFRLPYVLLFR